ncbi:chaperonin 10-like protein [Gilbertella persicaria]|uniref:Enoyl reductase (ER) domain-containing protein n=1 Tax=Rhizopus stolonifer TaxID=4846 RepID=A0A367KY12_RHIST|nr:chaperonin 10-like protein [Gilbertella persicaria]KAI8086960.1 chaperonin 10-like protein [Gilbertella persicaria]RCI07027.1 hypothetical protein CU098_012552 [Rhizopus stolonifer]
MRGIQLVKYGITEDCLVYKEDLPKPTIKSPYEVLVRVKAVGVNPVDAKLASGNISRFLAKLPSVIGGDYSGLIEEKGDRVTEFQVGDQVFGALPFVAGPQGSYAEYTIVDTSKTSIAKKPEHLSFEQAASAGIAVLTAYQALVKFSPISKQKRKILVVGASGGVGAYGIQIARAYNPENTVVGICSGKNAEFVKSLGADIVVDYTDKEAFKEFITRDKATFDHIFDCVGGDDYYNKLAPLLNKKGIYSTAVGPVEHIGSKPVGVSTIFSIVWNVGTKQLFKSNPYKIVTSLPHADFRTDIGPLFESKALRGMVIDEKENILPLKEAFKAHRKLLSHRTVGKIVLTVDE